MNTKDSYGQGPLVPNDIRYAKEHKDVDRATPYFGIRGSYRKIPEPLREEYNVQIPTIVVTDLFQKGVMVACVRFFAEIRGDKQKTELLDGFQYLFPLHINPSDEKLFPEGGKQRIFNCQVTSIDTLSFQVQTDRHDEIQFVCYESDPIRIVATRIHHRGHPWFGLLQPKFYGDPARGTPGIERVYLHGQ